MKEIIEYYMNNRITIKQLTKKFHVSHWKITKYLKDNNIKRARYSVNKGNKYSVEIRYKNMVAHIKFNITLDWIYQFKDIDKIMLLNHLICRGRISKNLNTEDYIKFIEKFYYDARFNFLFDLWVSKNKSAYYKPSIDHITPLSKGGENSVDNMQIITWSENRAKFDMSMEEFSDVKKYWVL